MQAFTFSMNAFIFKWSFLPGLASTPLPTSTAYGLIRRTAFATFPGVKPPASMILPYCFASIARSQLNVSPVPPFLPLT